MKDTSNSFGSDLAFVINVHERLVRDFPLTPYNMWCRRVHELPKTVTEKWELLLAWDLNPNEYSNPTLFAADYQLRCLLSKYSSDKQEDTSGKATAYRKFFDAENRCREINSLYVARIRPSGINQLVEYAKKTIADCLGPIDELIEWLTSTVDSSDWSTLSTFQLAELDYPPVDLPGEASFGPGVSVSAQGASLKSTVEKLELGTVTPSCWALLGPILKELRIPRPTLVKGSRLTFVPKKVGEMRSICFEPSVNMLFQKAVGRFIRMKLKAFFRINTRDQSTNRSLARLGSLADSWATIDLSSASDLIAYMVVLELIPPRWFAVLDALRSPGYTDPETGKFTLFEKFSSMGNGFTFELETLIFAAITYAAIRIWGDPNYQKTNVVVYGDDICVPKQHYDLVTQSLAVFGHIPNPTKSYAAGPFRESCGGDFFKGWDVTPLRIKELDLENPKTVINLHNRLYSLSERGVHPGLVGPWCSLALDYVANWLERNYPRVSGGEPELKYDKRIGSLVEISSDQWIWGSNRNRGTAWHCSLTRTAPKWLCIRQKTVICEYAVPDSPILNWLVGLRQGATVLVEEKTVFVPNPDVVPAKVTKRTWQSRQQRPLVAKVALTPVNR